MSSYQYDQYLNIITFAKEWRGYKLVSSILEKNDFHKHMQTLHMVRIDCKNTEQSRSVIIFLFDNTNYYNNSSQNIKRLLSKIKELSDVILISNAPLKSFSLRAINVYNNLNVRLYLHQNFNLIIPNGPLCYSHRILSRDEIDRLLNSDLCCYLTNLPKINIDDVQCIWIGAEVGDVIEIKSLSDITGESIHYRVVIPKSGSIVNFRNMIDTSKTENENTSDDKAIKEEEEYNDEDENEESGEE
jgi:DNA-directed RNA polymerase subunit H (RpoH/RPB5)